MAGWGMPTNCQEMLPKQVSLGRIGGEDMTGAMHLAHWLNRGSRADEQDDMHQIIWRRDLAISGQGGAQGEDKTSIQFLNAAIAQGHSATARTSKGSGIRSRQQVCGQRVCLL